MLMINIIINNIIVIIAVTIASIVATTIQLRLLLFPLIPILQIYCFYMI